MISRFRVGLALLGLLTFAAPALAQVEICFRYTTCTTTKTTILGITVWTETTCSAGVNCRPDYHYEIG